MKTRFYGFNLGLWALAFVSVGVIPTDAQVPVAQQARGWLGVEVEMQYTVAPRTGQNAFRIVVASVLAGSPAYVAGVRRGDQVTALGGNLVTQDRWMRSLTSITPGDQLSLTVVRAGGETGELLVTAGRRPASVAPTGAAQALRAAQVRMFRSIDSLLVMTTTNLSNLDTAGEGLRLFIRTQGGDDSLRILARGVEEQVRAIEGPPEPTALRRVTGQNVRAPRILTPHIVGEAFVLGGAQARTVTGGLAEYFGVEEGVLITDVLQRSLAAEIGLLPGDVIVSVGGHRANSVSQLRATLNRLTIPFDLEVRRKGETTTLRYPSQQ